MGRRKVFIKILQSEKELKNLLLAAYKEGMKRITYIGNLKFSENQYEKMAEKYAIENGFKSHFECEP